MIKLYKLEGHRVVLCASNEEWVIWLETADCCVAFDEIDGIAISTLFLGLDHNWSNVIDSFISDISGKEQQDPLLFETRIFLPNGDASAMMRYFTWEEAEQGHRKAVETILEARKETEEIANKALSDLIKKARVK